MRKIFICGLDRSGTTFLASILASIPDSTVISETPFKFEWLSQEKSKRIKEKYTEKYYTAFGFHSYREAFLSVSTEKILDIIDSKYKVIIDHTPKNRYFVSELFNKFEDTSVIFIFRDTFDVYLSHRNVPWGDRALAVVMFRQFQTTLQYEKAKSTFGSKVSKTLFEDLAQGNFIDVRDHLRSNEITYKKLMVQKITLPDYTKAQHSSVGLQPDQTKISKIPDKRLLRILKKIYVRSALLAFMTSLIFELLPHVLHRIRFLRLMSHKI
jgi:hypothetical protein